VSNQPQCSYCKGTVTDMMQDQRLTGEEIKLAFSPNTNSSQINMNKVTLCVYLHYPPPTSTSRLACADQSG
jgi:hypothetical protein